MSFHRSGNSGAFVVVLLAALFVFVGCGGPKCATGGSGLKCSGVGLDGGPPTDAGGVHDL